MSLQPIQQLQQFITDNKLRREDGLIVFEAAITFCKAGEVASLYSEVQVITLPQEMVLYIIEFSIPPLSENDMYSTIRYTFTCLPDQKLEISDTRSDNRLVISLD
jgi:hypothetical protein